MALLLGFALPRASPYSKNQATYIFRFLTSFRAFVADTISQISAIGRSHTIHTSSARPLQRYRRKLPATLRNVTSYRSDYWQSSTWDIYKPRVVTGGLIGLCCGLFGYNWYSESRTDTNGMAFIHQNFVSSPENLRAGRWWTVVTSSVMHFSGPHLFMNMYSLWAVGPICIGAFGVANFIGLWVVAEVACSSAHLYWKNRGEQLRRKLQGWRFSSNRAEFAPTYGGAVGASGSLLGMTTLLMCLRPSLPVYPMFIPIATPLWAFNLAFASFSVYCLTNEALPWLGHAGHLGGMAGGVIYYYGLLRPWLRRTGRF